MAAGERAKPTAAEQAETSVVKTSISKASVKEAIGKLTGDARVEAEGNAQKRRAPPSRTAAHDD